MRHVEELTALRLGQRAGLGDSLKRLELRDRRPGLRAEITVGLALKVTQRF
jgi:hypothetical protein